MAVNPVTLRPGRARLSAKPLATGSPKVTATIGTVADARRAAPVAAVPEVTMTSAFALTSSPASSARLSNLPSAKRHSIARLRPSV